MLEFSGNLGLLGVLPQRYSIQISLLEGHCGCVLLVTPSALKRSDEKADGLCCIPISASLGICEGCRGLQCSPHGLAHSQVLPPRLAVKLPQRGVQISVPCVMNHQFDDSFPSGPYQNL
jgi:hypothetical protein